jgi:hypothetical protein
MEGESLTLTRFDELKKDEAHAWIIEMGRDEMVSSHSKIKRGNVFKEQKSEPHSQKIHIELLKFSIILLKRAYENP